MKYWFLCYQSQVSWTSFVRANNLVWQGTHPFDWLIACKQEELTQSYVLVFFMEITQQDFEKLERFNL